MPRVSLGDLAVDKVEDGLVTLKGPRELHVLNGGELTLGDQALEGHHPLVVVQGVSLQPDVPLELPHGDEGALQLEK